MAVGFATSLRNARANAITAARDAGAGAGKIRIYDGTRPSTGGTATTLLAELTFSDPSAPSAASGILTANAINDDAAANGTGVATWFREVDSDDNFILDGDVGVELTLNDANISTGVPVSITSYVITEGNA